jgi:hypothetical protein
VRLTLQDLEVLNIHVLRVHVEFDFSHRNVHWMKVSGIMARELVTRTEYAIEDLAVGSPAAKSASYGNA